MKMKQISVYGLCFLMAFTACQIGNGSNNSRGVTAPALVGISDDYQIDFNVQYIRTNNIVYVEGLNYPLTSVISSASELEQYYENYKDKYALSIHSSDSSIRFIDAIRNYSNDFFKNNFLVMVLLEENSGSIRHKLEGIYNTGDIIISRLLPKIGTDDMAEWHIIIELKNNFVPEKFKVVLNNLVEN
jgi:hypothetical protein